MRLILPTVKEVIQEPGLDGLCKQIAIAGRICYASDKTTDNVEFVNRLIKSQHFRPLEFGTVYLKISMINDLEKLLINELLESPWTRYKCVDGYFYITTNYRVIKEASLDRLMIYRCEPTEDHYVRRTFQWTIARSIADEFRTHVSLSALMQSTRYCDYSKDKFNNEVCFVKPHWLQSCDYFENDFLGRDYINALKRAEYDYFKFRESGLKPEDARGILPLDVKTEFIQCGFEEDWEHFIDLRFRGTTGAPHPDAKLITGQMCNLFYNDEVYK